MPLVKEVNFNDPTFPNPTFISEWINLEASSYTVYTVFCSENCDLVINWAVDDGFQIIDSTTVSLTGGTTEEIIPISKALFAQYTVINIASNPANLKVQLFFYS